MTSRRLCYANNTWESNACDLASFAESPVSDATELIFVDFEDLADIEPYQEALTSRYRLQPTFWDHLYFRSNGFASCIDVTESGDQGARYNICFRYEVKHVRLQRRLKPYFWDSFTCLLHLSSSGNVSGIIFNPPKESEDLHDRLQVALPSPASFTQGSAEQLVTFIDCILAEVARLYEDSVWKMRDIIRDIELNRDIDKENQTYFQEMARHALHISEVSEVAISTTEELLHYAKAWLPSASLPVSPRTTALPASSVQHRAVSRLRLHLQSIRNLHRRAHAIDRRFTIEIEQASFRATKDDNKLVIRMNEAMLLMNRAMHADARAMKTIALVTLIFLPSTYVSTIFGMSFFDSSTDEVTGQVVWTMATQFWIFWVVSIPLTILTIVIWMCAPWIRSTSVARSVSRFFNSLVPKEQDDHDNDNQGYQMGNIT